MKTKLLATLVVAVLSTTSHAILPLEKITLPKGFKISVLASIPNARSLSVAPDGRIFVGNKSGSKVYVIQDGKTKVFADGLDTPNGVAYKDGKLYVGEVSRILELDAALNTKLPVTKYRVLPQTFPSDTHHGWKFIRFGPDGMLYVPVGANCNICDPGKNYARLFKIDVHGTSKIEVAQGIRNTVGFDWNPDNKEMWFTDNGRDMLGDDIPPDELNHIALADTKNKIPDFGFPTCFGKSVSDPEFGKKRSCTESIAPALELRAHVASLGMRFYQGKMFPKDFQKNIFIAEHGSWNRTIPQGYRITRVQFDDKGQPVASSFAEGWLQNGTAWGRPADVDVLADGSLIVSDDEAGAVYQIKK